MAKTTARKTPTPAPVPPAVARSGRAKNPEFSTLSVYIPRDLHLQTKVAALTDGRELSDVVETLLRAWLAGRKG